MTHHTRSDVYRDTSFGLYACRYLDSSGKRSAVVVRVSSYKRAVFGARNSGASVLHDDTILVPLAVRIRGIPISGRSPRQQFLPRRAATRATRIHTGFTEILEPVRRALVAVLGGEFVPLDGVFR